jgi:predicted PurR-regulated permease PerM
MSVAKRFSALAFTMILPALSQSRANRASVRQCSGASAGHLAQIPSPPRWLAGGVHLPRELYAPLIPELSVDTSPSTIVRDPWFRALVILGTIIAALYLGQRVWELVSQVGDLVILFIVAWMISFVLEPTVAALSQFARISRPTAVIFVYVLLFLALASAGMLLAPVLAAQAVLAAEQLPTVAASLEGWANSAMSFLSARGILPATATQQLLRPAEALGTAVFSNAVVFATSAASAVVQILLVIIISLYLMLDSERIGRTILSAVPGRYRHDFIYFTSSVHRAFGGFLRGQIIQGLVYGLGIAVMMLALNLKFVALASVSAGVAMFIPFIGPGIGFVPPILAALASETPNLWLVVLLTLAINIAVVNAVAPKVMSQQIGLHPILVLAAFLGGARIAGPWGALLGVPIAAIIVTMVSFYQLTVSERSRRVLELIGDEQEPVGAPTATPRSGAVAPRESAPSETVTTEPARTTSRAP